MDDLIVGKIKGVEVKFKTKPGVFSRQGLDLGSKLLVEKVDFSKLPEKGMVADLGCGSGVIGFFVAKLNPLAHVHLLDVNLRSVELAEENAKLNRLYNVEVHLSDNFSAVAERSYHLILSNPAQHLGNEYLKETAKDCYEHLKPGGEVYWVVQSHVKPVIERLFEKNFGNCTIVAHGKEHVVLKGEKDGN